MAGPVDNRAGLIARWGNKTWKITQDQIEALSDASLNVEYDKSSKKSKWKREASVSYPLYRGLIPNLDIAQEIWEWRSLVKKKNVLYVGGVAFGGYKKFQLTGVNASKIQVAGGEIVQCEIELTFVAQKKSHKIKKYKRQRKQLRAS